MYDTGVVIAWSSFATRERKRREPKLPFPTLSCRGSVTKHLLQCVGSEKNIHKILNAFSHDFFFIQKFYFLKTWRQGKTSQYLRHCGLDSRSWGHGFEFDSVRLGKQRAPILDLSREIFGEDIMPPLSCICANMRTSASKKLFSGMSLEKGSTLFTPYSYLVLPRKIKFVKNTEIS